MQIGKFKRNVDLVYEYQALAEDDEGTAVLLCEAGRYRQSCYFVIQAMEKYVRAKIFTLVDGTNAYYRNRQRNHSIEDALEFLVEVIASDQQIRDQVKKQLQTYVVGDLKFHHLHNDLRYPAFFERNNSYSRLEIENTDQVILMKKLVLLKKFLKDLQKVH